MWGGGCTVFLTFYAFLTVYEFMQFPTFLEKKIWECKTIISHLMFSLCFFMLEILKSAPSLTATAKWEVVSPNSRYREF